MNEFELNKEYNWQTYNQPIIKKYVAELFQAGTDAPVATELFNDTGLYFQYTYLGPGLYEIKASKPIFDGATSQKVQISITNQSFTSVSSFNVVAYPLGLSGLFDTMQLVSFTEVGAADDLIGNFDVQNKLEITFYK